MKKNKKIEKKSLFFYFITTFLCLAFIAVGATAFFCHQSISALKEKNKKLSQTVQELSATAQELTKKAEELEAFQKSFSGEFPSGNAENAGSSENTPEPPPGVREDGTPFSSENFSGNADDALNTLMSQISSGLPANNGSWSFYVCNLQNNTESSFNNQSMQAASLIKLFIMGTVYENYDLLSNQYGRESINANLHSMITVSDNDASNTLVTWLGDGDNLAGMAKVNAFCSAHGYTATSMGRMLLQSNENGDNYTSVQDCGAFLREVYRGDASSLAHASQMYQLLKQQERLNKIPAALPEGVQVANKTGELGDVENDAGIIYNTVNGTDLVICFMSQNLNNTGEAQQVIAQSSRQIYSFYNE